MLNYFTYPISFFLIGLVFVYFIVKPIVDPALKFSKVMLLDHKPTFETTTKDLFANIDTNNLDESSNSIKLKPEQLPVTGQRYGQIKIKNVNIDAPIYFGDSDQELLQGVGTYAEGYLPGAGHTILMTAHNNLHFFNLGYSKEGDIIEIDTNYGKYQYEIYDTQIKKSYDQDAYDLKKEEENLIVYTCYPLDGIGITDERLFIYAKYLKGPKLELIY